MTLNFSGVGLSWRPLPCSLARGSQARCSHMNYAAFQTFFMLPRSYAHNPSNRGRKIYKKYIKSSKFAAGCGAA